MNQISARIISHTELMPGIRLISVEAPDIVNAARPGQFVMVRCGRELTLRRPISIHKVENGTRLYLLCSVVGKGTGWLSQHGAGEALDLIGPLGNWFSIKPSSRNLLLIAGGIGIAPLTFLAQEALALGKSVALLAGACTAAQLCPQQYLPGSLRTAVATEDGTAGHQGMVTDILPGFISQADEIYACGPAAMYPALDRCLRQETPKKPAHISLEVRMGCGIGACYGCSIKTRHGMKQVCRDGPVFDLDEVLWEEVKL